MKDITDIFWSRVLGINLRGNNESKISKHNSEKCYMLCMALITVSQDIMQSYFMNKLFYWS